MPKYTNSSPQSQKENKNIDKIPCYRVVRSDEKVGGYCGSGRKNIQRKIRMLENDGIDVRNGKADLEKTLIQALTAVGILFVSSV